ncbi:WD40 repeat domain-containing protein [Sulfurimonas sp.]|uniref:WD40 repeat domain-containing protein n=1 Tax=Sulfurimonas sp. TaxID=2022749 RepID=UPI003562AAFE
MQATKEMNFKEAIIKIKILDDGKLLVVDSKTVVRFLDLNTLSTISGFKGGISHLRFKNHVVDFSSDASKFVVLNESCSEALLFDTKSKKVLTKIDRHHGEVSCVAIEPKNKYMFTGGDDGKTYATDMGNKKIAFTLPVHVDTVNDIAFSENGQWVATASYDKKVQIFNMTMMARKHRLVAHANPVMKVHFLSEHRLVSIDKKSSAIIWDYYSGKVITRLEGIHDDVLHITTDRDGKFLFLGTQLGYILVYELESYKILSKKYIKLTSPITALSFDKNSNHLIVGTQSGDLLFYSIYEGVDYIKEQLKVKDYEAIQRYVEQNPLLAYTKIYQLVINLWDTTLKKAKLSLEAGDKQTAINLFKHFKNIPSKNSIMQKVMLEYEEFDRFAMLAKQGKLALAYSLALKHPMYKDSKVYKTLEAAWKKAFAAAQKQAIDPKGADIAREILAPYRGITQKTKLIQELLTKSEVYKRFRIAIGQKDFIIAFELIKQHPFLKEFSDYEALISYADSLYINSQKLLQVGDTHSAIKILRVLVDFSDFTEEVKALMRDIENKQKFYNAIEDGDSSAAYNLLSIDDELQESEDGKMLQKEWNDDLLKANEYALEGNVKKLNEVLKKYMKISSKNNALANIYGWCYMAQLEHAVESKKDQAVIENGIKNYILYFGLQEQIESFFHIFKQKYPRTKLTLDLQTKGSISMWRASMIVKSILD